MRKGTHIDRGYATIINDDGCNYRTISEQMSARGFKMNHSSARNYVIRAMDKFVSKFSVGLGIKLSDEQRQHVIRSPAFQSAMHDILQRIACETPKKDQK